MVILDSTKLVIPTSSQKTVLTELHRTHSGITKTYETATPLYYWPGMIFWRVASHDTTPAHSHAHSYLSLGTAQKDMQKHVEAIKAFGCPLQEIPNRHTKTKTAETYITNLVHLKLPSHIAKPTSRNKSTMSTLKSKPDRASLGSAVLLKIPPWLSNPTRNWPQSECTNAALHFWIPRLLTDLQTRLETRTQPTWVVALKLSTTKRIIANKSSFFILFFILFQERAAKHQTYKTLMLSRAAQIIIHVFKPPNLNFPPGEPITTNTTRLS